MYVIKRSGHRQKLDIEKIRKVISFATEGLNVKPEELEMDAHIQFFDGIKSEQIQQLLIKTASEKISPQEPDWTYVASRLLLYDLYKRVSHKRGYKIKEKKDGKFSPYCHQCFYELIEYGVKQGIYGNYLLNFYSKEDILYLAKHIRKDRDLLFTYTGLKVLSDRYLIRDKDNQIIELPQEMYMLIAMTLALPEKDEDRLKYVVEFYNALSRHEITVATPTLMNARRPHTQLSSCFVLTVDDDLYDMYDNLQKMAQISKYAGGIGAYLGKIRATGSTIRGFKNASSGIIPYIKVINDTMVYVNQLGMRKGSASLTIDVWHKDIFDFLEVKTNAGDERKKAHDIHPAISIPDIFMRRVQENKEWTLICPTVGKKYALEWTVRKIADWILDKSEHRFLIHYKPYRNRQDIYKLSISGELPKKDLDSLITDILPKFIGERWIMNTDLQTDKLPESGKENEPVKFTLFVFFYWKNGIEDFYGEEFEQIYEFMENSLEQDGIDKVLYRKVNAFDLWKKILTVAFETGEPYIFFRDNVNKVNPNKHEGVIYSSNLCHEIALVMSLTKHLNQNDLGTFWELPDKTAINLFKNRTHSKQENIKHVKESGYVPVCNLGSINLGKVNTEKDFELIIPTLVRMLDNVIDLNFYPVKETEITNKLFRSIGIGVSNYHYLLVKNNIRWESEEHLKFADKLFEQIAFYTIKASMELAKERGKYPLFDGSEWSEGIFFGMYKDMLMKETKENENNLEWDKLVEEVKQYGLRNANLLALMPTGSTSLILGATPSIDPIFAKYYKEENMSGVLPQIPPEINKYFWHYKTAYTIDHIWTVKAGAKRQKWIDQAQSLNIFIDPEKITGKQLSEIYMTAWKEGLKTIYYLRSKSMSDTVEDCESCSV